MHVFREWTWHHKHISYIYVNLPNTYIHIYIHSYLPTDPHTYMHIYIHEQGDVSGCEFRRRHERQIRCASRLYACIHIHIHTYTHTYIRTWTRSCIGLWIFQTTKATNQISKQAICMHTYIHTYMGRVTCRTWSFEEDKKDKLDMQTGYW
jgi:hypothetical protein